MFPFDPNLTQIVVLSALCAIVASFFFIQFILLLGGLYKVVNQRNRFL